MRSKFILVFALFMLGCTREMASKSSVMLSVPSQKVGSLATGPQLTRVVVNIRGSGIAGGVVTYIWDGKDSGVSAPPQEIYIEVPSGPDRLIQYLGIYEDSSSATQSMTFRYGKALKSLAPGPQDVEIFASVLNTSGGRTGNVAGQYMLYDGIASGAGVFGPTTKMAMEVLPDPNDPPMVVDYGEMFNGWMTGVAIEGVPTQYRLLEQNVLLSDLGYDVLAAVSTTSRMFHMRVAPHFRWSGGAFESHEGGDLFLGFFGPWAAAVTRKVHYTTGSVSIPDTYLTESFSQPLDWMVSGEAEWINHGDNTTPTGVAYVDHLEFVPERLRNGPRDAAGFRGPFAMVGTVTVGGCSGGWDGMVYACMYDANANATHDLRLDFKYLPGVTITNGYSRGVQGVSAFAINRLSCPGQDCHQLARNPGGDGYRCREMGQIPGMIFLGDVPASQESITFYDPSLPGGEYELFLCPYRSASFGREYFASGAGGGLYVSGSGTGALTISGFTGGEDGVIDSYMVGNGAMSIHFGAEPGAVSYAVSVWDPSLTTNYCTEVAYGAPATPVSCLSALTSDGAQYKAIIKSFDSFGSQMSQTETTFSRVLQIPSISFSSLGCSSSWDATHLTLDLSYTVSSQIVGLSWQITYTGNSSGSNSLSYVSATGTTSLNSGITISTGSPTTINHLFELHHSSGLVQTYNYPTPSEYDGGYGCTY